MLSQLQGLFLLDQVRKTVLHGHSVLLVHLQLVCYPVPVVLGEDRLSQVVVPRLRWLIIDHILLLSRVFFENTLPLIRIRVGPLHRKLIRYLVNLLPRLLRDAQVQLGGLFVSLPHCTCGIKPAVVVVFTGSSGSGTMPSSGISIFSRLLHIWNLFIQVSTILFEFTYCADD